MPKSVLIRMLESRRSFSVWPWLEVGPAAIRSFRRMLKMRERSTLKRQTERLIDEQTEEHRMPLPDWIRANLGSQFPRNADVYHPAFPVLYVRLGPRWLGPDLGVEWCLQIARIEARRRGQGSFKRLIAELRSSFPTLPIYVELVQSDQFADGLLRMGFVALDAKEALAPSFVLLVE